MTLAIPFLSPDNLKDFQKQMESGLRNITEKIEASEASTGEEPSMFSKSYNNPPSKKNNIQCANKTNIRRGGGGGAGKYKVVLGTQLPSM